MIMIMPPLVVLVRRARPVLTVLGLAFWFVYRLSPIQTDQSLLRLLVQALTVARDELLSKLAAMTNTYASTIGNPLLQLVVEWLWRVSEDIMAFLLVMGTSRVVYCLCHFSLEEWKDLIVDGLFEWANRHVGLVNKEMNKQTAAFNTNAEQMLHKDPHRVKTLTLPKKGRPRQEVLQELQTASIKENAKWQQGKVSGTVYSKDSDHSDFLNQVYAAYSWSNPLHPGYWPKLNQCEAEVIAMTADMLHGPAVGCMSSGGTESILLAIRAHLCFHGKHRGIAHPELICGTTAHAAVNKACEIFGIRMVTVDCSSDGTFQLDPAIVKSHVTANTIMLYASAPCYPQGVIDPIEALGEIAQEYGIGLHVDACLGGFVLPFCDDAPVFDFRCKGVTSMSADTHKYGFSTKGTSVVMYNSEELRSGQYFAFAKWTGGMYATPSFAGSRPGALSACAWAAMVSLGREGYRSRVALIVKAARTLATGVKNIDGLKLLTPKPYMVVCLGGSEEVDIYRIQDFLTTAGWSFSSLQSPASIHICVTLNVVPNMEILLQDLRAAVEKVRSEGTKGSKKGTAGVYGTVEAVPPGPVNNILRAFTDATLSP